MVLAAPSRPMSILIVSKNQSDGQMLCYGVQDALGKDVRVIDMVHDLAEGAHLFAKTHHDVVLVHGWPSSHSEAFIFRVRNEDGNRHTGVIVLAPTSDGYDQLAVDNFNAGADEVVPMNISLVILRSKMIMVFNLKATTDLLRAANHKLQQMAVTDELTGCANMRGFSRKFASAIAACGKGTTGVAILMMDLDHFKKVNDNHNHLVGSHVIRATGQLLLNSKILEANDVAARYGGDEFIVMLLGQDAKTQVEKARKIRAAIERNEFEYDTIKVRVTASIGVAWAAPGFGGHSADLVKAADAMLYHSKENGRNQVNAMSLRYPIDFENIGTTHMMDGRGSDLVAEMTAKNKKIAGK